MLGPPLALLALAACHCVAAPESSENESEPDKSSAPEKPWKASPELAEPDLATAGGGAEWTSWFNIDHPGGGGDYESLDAIRFYYGARVCARPVAVQARTTEWELPRDVGQVVHVSPDKGFRCVNTEQPPGKTCSNYHVRFLCPLEHIYWSHWSPWSPCPRGACAGRGTQSRRRRCVSARHPGALKELKCKGKAVERRPCGTGPCPEASWGEWGAWGPCSRSCGDAAKRQRRRTCPRANKSPCAGRATEVQPCPPTPCPACPGHVLQGTVVSAAGAALPGARVFLEGRPPALLARSDARGRFHVPGLCLGAGANLSAHLEKFAPALAPVVSNGSGLSVARLVLQRLEKPYMVTQPQGLVRRAGQAAAFCCDAAGTPAPTKYFWYHNGTLLDRKALKYGSRLALRALTPAHAGTYHCKASSEAGAIRSAPAQLVVLAPGQQSCKPEPEPNLIELPGECSGGGGGPRYYDVGQCPAAPCGEGHAGAEPQCGQGARRCCGVRRTALRHVPCGGSLLPVKVVAECGCGPCVEPRVLVRGRVTAADSGEPLRFGHVFLGKEKIGFTGYQGSFTIEVPPGTQRLVARFVDRQQRFVDAVKVLPFDRRGGAVYQEVKMMRKKEPVALDAGRANAIPLGEARGREPVGELVIPAGAFLRPSGEVFEGTVSASVTFLDPRDMATAGAAPSDLSFANAEGELVPLRTYGMFAVDFREGETNEVLQTGPVEVRMDAGQIRMPEHLHKMKLWSLNPDTGLWEEEGVFRQVKERRGKREDRTFLVGNMEIRERRLFNLDVPENRRCFVKVRAYSNEKFNAHEQLEGVVINLINLEPRPGYPTNPRAWGRFDSVVTGPNGACLPAFCDGQRPDAYSAYVTATLGGEELEAVASSPRLEPSAVGVSQPYLNKLGYRRLDHDEPSLKKTAFQLHVAKPDPNNVDETNGPVYPYRGLQECERAPASANHFRFYRVEVDKYEYNVVPFKESDLTSWTGDYLSWWPNPQEFRACFIKVRLEGPQEYMVRARSAGGSHPRTRGQLYGLRDARSVRDPQLQDTSGACVEFKCSGMLFDQSLVDRTLVTVVPQGSCRRTATNSLLRDYLARHPPLAGDNNTAAFAMLAPVDPLGHNYGIYTVTDQNPRLAKEIAIGRCFDGTSDGFSREMKASAGTAVTFTCRERPAARRSFFERLLRAPAEALAEMRREMGSAEQRRAPPDLQDFASGWRAAGPAPGGPGGRRRVRAQL